MLQLCCVDEAPRLPVVRASSATRDVLKLKMRLLKQRDLLEVLGIIEEGAGPRALRDAQGFMGSSMRPKTEVWLPSR
jgi:hypothetical protein